LSTGINLFKQESRGNAGRIARCRCKFRYIIEFYSRN